MPYKDREKQLEAQRAAYHKKREYFRELQKKRKAELKIWFYDLLSKLKCNRCPENDSACLEFHHIDPTQKEEPIGYMVRRIRTKESILKEISKCEILCANCHRKHHSKEREK